MKDHVYLAGPIEDCGPECADWRAEAGVMLANAGIKCLDPTRRIQFHKQMMVCETNSELQSVCRRIFKIDMQDIANSNVVVADVRRSAGRGTGTAMELMFAHTKNKIIILWADEEDYVHPFYESIYTEKYHTLAECIDAATAYFS